MRRVWLRHGDDLRSFPVKKVGKKNRVLVKPIADVWSLKASTISIGENCLVSCSVDVKEMRELAAESGQAGDGQSRESAIEIRGSSKRKRKEKDVFDGRKSTKREALTVRKPMNSFERSKMYNDGPTEEQRARTARYRKWQQVQQAVFFGPGCMYEYSNKLLSLKPNYNCRFNEQVAAFEELLFCSVRPFVGTLHVLSSDQQQQEVEEGHCVAGMVTLWKLDGACLTAYDCVKDALSNNKLLFVSLQPVPGKKVVYQCKAEVVESWALLQPVEPDKIGFNFTSCIRLSALAPAEAPMIQYTFSLEEGELKNVKATSVRSSSDLQDLLPTSRVCTLGAPVFQADGGLSGIVTDFVDVDKQPSDVNTVELETRVHSYKWLHNIYQVLLEGLKSKQLVKATRSRAPALVNPLDQWLHDHPIEEVCPA